MFKRLRERIAEEGIKFPVSQPNTPNSGKQGNTETDKTAIGNSTEDLITLSNSPSVVVPHTSSQQFSIGEDEDGSMSEQNTPQKKHNDSFNGSTSEQFYTPTRDNSNSVSDLGYGPQYRPSKSHYIPQSDIESEREDPPTLNLESISKDQLLTIIDMLKAKSYKYKNKYSEVVKNFKELRDEKLKIETTLTEHQDKALRRIAELREQCQLEQKAKAHLEANLRLMLEEKDSRISVLETQINLLKKDQSNSFNCDPNEIQTSDASTGDSLISTSSSEVDVNAFQEKMERFEHQITQAKKTITNQTEQLSLLRKQNESISSELEEKIKALNEMEDQLGNAKSQHEFILKGMQGRLEELEQQQEESLMSMAETKKNMHEELEFKEKQLRKAEEEAKQLQIACDTEKSKVLEIQKLHEGKVKELQRQLESTERMLEDEKQNLMQELGRGKTAAISLMQQECAKKIAAVEEEWKVKLENYESQKNISEEQNVQVKDLEKKVAILKEKLMISEEQGKELIGMIQKLNDENKNLKSSLEKSNSEFASASEIFEKLQEDYKDFIKSKDPESPFIRKLSEETNCDSQESKLQKQLKNFQILFEGTYKNIEMKCQEIEKLKEQIKHFEMELQNAAQNFDNKIQEVIKLEELVQQYQHCEKENLDSLQNQEKDMQILKVENNELKLNLKVMDKESENLKNRLLVCDEDIHCLNNIIEKDALDISDLNQCILKKEEGFKSLENKLIKIDNDFNELEKIKSVQSSLLEYNLIFNKWNEKADFIINVLDSQNIKDLFSKFIVSSAENEEKKSEYEEKLNENIHIDEEDQIKILPFSEKSDFSSSNVSELQVIIHKLLGENRKLKQDILDLKELSEFQNIESAKNITQLYESLNQLQEERNNLSLVLQSFESQSVESENPDNNKVHDSNTAVKANHRVDLTELNCKVKSEIAALSAQTELINAEFKKLKDQFNISHFLYSEKLTEMNIKLMRKMETILGLKEDLDESITNNENLKNILEITYKELSEKNELVTTNNKYNQELENKIKVLKENFVKNELHLKQQHNSQLSDLKNHTQATIEKLTEEIQKANSLIKEKEVWFTTELSKLKTNYDEEASTLKQKEIQLVQMLNMIDKGFNSGSSIETLFLPSLDKLQSYESKIEKMNDKLKKVALKFQEKVSSLSVQKVNFNNIQDESKALVQEKENLHLELNEKVKLLCACQAELQQEKEIRNKYENDFKALKNELNFTVKQLESSSKIKNEVTELKEQLNTSKSENKQLLVKFEEVSGSLAKTLTEAKELKVQNSQFIELQQKYDNLLVSLKNSDKNLETERQKFSEVSLKLEAVYSYLRDSFSSFSLKSEDQLQLCLLRLSERESQLKQLESFFNKLSVKFKSQSLCVMEKKKKIEELEDANKSLIQEMQVISEGKSELELKLFQIKEGNMTEIESLQTELNQTKEKLEATQADIQCQTSELNSLREEMSKLKENICKTEENNGLISAKLEDSEKAFNSLEIKYISAKKEVENALEAARVSNDKLVGTLKQLESKNVLIASMVPIEKLEESKHLHTIEIEQLNNLITKLRSEIQSLSSDIKKREVTVRNIQLEKENLVNHHDENLKCVTDKLENAERNYATQMSEMKSRILLLEKEKLDLENEKSELLKVRERLSNLEEGESAIKSELQSKDDELKKLQQKYETSNKDQSQKIQNFQESMKDKENMIVKLKASIATITKENAEKIEEFKKRIKDLEKEREQLMIQAQERVSTTEAKCRDDIKALQEKNNKLLLDNKEMEKIRSKCTQLEKELLDVRVQSESQLSAVDKELSLLKEQLLRVEGQLKDSEKAKEVLETELSGRVNKLQEENSLLLGKSNHFESLKAEKEELNEKLKQAEQQVTSVKQLENEKENLKRDNASISLELERIKARCLELETKLKSLEKRELQYKSEMKKLESRNQNLESEIAVLKSSLDSEIKEKEDLLQKVNSLEVSQSSNTGTTSAIEEEMDQKLKNLVRDFSIQMDNKDKDCDKILAESLDKEEKLINEHRTEIASLRQTMFEKDCALDEMREHYQEILLEKETKLKDLQMSIKKLSENNGSNASNDSALLTTEGSDWDETWAVPEEECIENTSPVHITCKEHLLQIESLQEELSKCNCEIKELKVLLRLSPPESMNNNQRDSYQSLPEPTELEYLKNIIFEYMMGKEPITLAKVIAAVLRFSDTQTQQVIRREEAKHPTVSHWLSPK